MKKYLLTVMIILQITIYNFEVEAGPFDTGMIELQQPDETTFIGRIWGDEFFSWAETEDGYRFVQSGDGWYYYAELNEDGEFSPSKYKVGIDTPQETSYQLDRTQARIDEINQQIEEFNEQIELNRQWFAEMQSEAQGAAVTLKVAIILIEFQDVKHYKTTEPPNIRPNGYFTSDFDSMMFSNNFWYAPNLQFESPHPENELLFGSFRDYWHQMSRGKLKIIGKVVNPTDENGVPEWLEADHTRAYYADTCAAWSDSLAEEAMIKALASGYISLDPGDSNYYHKYAIVYARDAISLGALKVHAQNIGAKYHFLAERSGRELYGPNKGFTHIGIYAHEFAHTIGFFDEYSSESKGQTDIFNFCLMDVGIYNGPDRKAACPATLSSLNRIERSWISSIPTQDTSDFIVQYSYTNPIVYRIDPVDANGDEHYLIESKGRVGFDLYIPSDPADTVNQPGRLLIWHANVNRIASYDSSIVIDHMILKSADSISNGSTQLTDFFPATFSPTSQSINDATMPASTLGYFDNWPAYIDNERPAHFALNGIQKLTNGNSLIDEINLHHIINTNSGSWQTVSVPFVLSDYSLLSVFPTVDTNSVYKYQSGYIKVNSLANGPGYYAKFPSSPQTITLDGQSIEYLEIHLNNGWNLTGTISFQLPRANVCTDPPGILTGDIYYYDGGYHYLNSGSTINPGIGYWIKTNNTGDLILDRFANPCELSKITSHSQIDFSTMDKFIITDSEGKKQNLYVSNIDIDPVMAGIDLELPPFFSELDFDSRFEYNEYVKKVSADSGIVDLNILVHTYSYPVSLTWELNPENGINYSFISDSGMGKISAIKSTHGSISFNKLENKKIQLKASANSSSSLNNIPTEYTLYQNYPNPFNPTTTIKYDLPNTGEVSLIIYDVLGRKVKTLINETQQAGRYEISFDALGMASGVYLYQLKSNNYINTKKMILLK